MTQVLNKVTFRCLSDNFYQYTKSLSNNCC